MTDVDFNGDTMLCPACGGTFLHQWKIVGYTRKGGEDGESVARVYDDRGAPDNILKAHPEGKTNLPKNPSSRRDAISIHFWCEGCDSIPKLNIVQHKGETYLKWDSDLK